MRAGTLPRAAVLLAVGVAVSVGLRGPAVAQPGPPPQLGVADTHEFSHGDAAAVARRMRLYRDMGIGNVRGVVGWADSSPEPGRWVAPSELGAMQAAVAAGLRLKIDLETIANPPGWLFAADPGARLVDSNGQVATHTVSPWYPGLRAMVSQASDALLRMLADHDLLSHADSLIVSLGTADEPIYPPRWTMGPGAPEPGFWYFDPYARADFRRRMQEAHGSLDAANAAWGTSYAAWSDVVPPAPAAADGRLWRDTLAWYRDTKRDFVRWQVLDTLRLLRAHAPAGHVPALVILVPGNHLSPREWDAANASGAAASAAPKAVIMTDTEFLLTLAAEVGAVVQFTGMPDAPELGYIQSFIASRHLNVAVTGENAGERRWAAMPHRLAAEAFGFGLRGFDLINSGFLFEADGTTPNALLAETADADRQLVRNWALGKASSLALPADFTLVADACVTVDGTQDARLCLSGRGALRFLRGNSVAWQASAPAQDCAADGPWPEGCHLTFQGDGNLVLYNGAAPYWNTATGAGAVRLVVSADAPHLSVTDGAGAVLWSSGR